MGLLRCFLSVATLFLWINRPILMRCARSLDTFKRQLNTVVLRRFFLTPLGLLRDPGGLKGMGRGGGGVRGPQAKTFKLRSLTIRPPNYYTRWCTQKVQMTAGNEATSSWFRKWQMTFSQITTKSLVKLRIFLGKSCRDEVISTWAVNSCLGLQKPYRYVRIKWTAKTIGEDPASCKRWISRKEI